MVFLGGARVIDQCDALYSARRVEPAWIGKVGRASGSIGLGASGVLGWLVRGGRPRRRGGVV